MILGSFLFNNILNQSYFIIFSINAVIVMLAILYSMFNLKVKKNGIFQLNNQYPTCMNILLITFLAQWRTSIDQKSISCNKMFGDFSNEKHAVDTIEILCKKRPNNRRVLLWILLFAMFFYEFPRDERSYKYLHTAIKFGWKVEHFSRFEVLDSVMQILIVLIGSRIMMKVFKWRETTVAMLGTIFFTIARIFFAYANVSEVFYVGACFSGLGSVTGNVLLSITSKINTLLEKGKVLVLLSFFGNVVPLVSSFLYTQVYKFSIGSFPGIYILKFISQTILFVLLL